MELYPFIKLLHISTAIISISLFTYRASLKLKRPSHQARGWLHYSPHLNDSILLSCAIYLAIKTQQYPFSTDWLSVKVIALFTYILLGMVVLRYARTQAQRITAFILALISFAYILAVAINRSPFAGF